MSFQKKARSLLVRLAYDNPSTRTQILSILDKPDEEATRGLVRLAHAHPELRSKLLPLLSKEARVDMKFADRLFTSIGNRIEKSFNELKQARGDLKAMSRVAPMLEDWPSPQVTKSRYEKPHHYALVLGTLLDEDILPKLRESLNTYDYMVNSWEDGVKFLPRMAAEKMAAALHKEGWGEKMREATVQEFRQALAKAGWPPPKYMPAGMTLTVEYKDRGTLVATKLQVEKRGKVISETYSVNEAYLS